MTTRKTFRAGLLIAVVLLLLVAIYLCAIEKSDLSNRVALFNLLVDIAVGTFTVWGLYWAATEFAESRREPVLRLIVLRESGGGYVMAPPGEPIVLQGQNNQCRCGLTVSNAGSVIAKQLYLEFRFSGANIIKVEDELCITPFPPGVTRAPDFSYHGLYMSFGEDVACHPGQEHLHLARLKLTFKSGTMPRELLLSYILRAEKMQAMKDSIPLTIDWQRDDDG